MKFALWKHKKKRVRPGQVGGLVPNEDSEDFKPIAAGDVIIVLNHQSKGMG